MKQKNLLIALICVLGCVLLVGVGFIIYLSLPGDPAATQPSAVTTEATTAPPETTQETTQETTVPEETAAETTAPTEPQPITYTLTFVGDCTLANQVGRTGKETFIATVGDDYAYPFADVQQYFASDDCTFINLENALTNRGTAANKRFVFRGPPEYVNILTQGSVEFANIANNHAKDYGSVGYEDTAEALKGAGIWYGGFSDSTLFTTESGLKIGVYTAMQPDNVGVLQKAIKSLKDQGAEVVIGCFHWGSEYYYRPSANQKKMARAAIDAGADIVYGHHPHVLQPIETYGGGVILYSLGNFSFGGNSNPGDKDTAIIQQQIIRDVDGSISLGELNIIPCHVTGTISVGNDYQPVPMEETFEGYQRVLQKLDGSWPLEMLKVSYRDDLFPTDPTDPTGEATDPTGEATDPSHAPTDPSEPSTEPVETSPEPTNPPETTASPEPTNPPTPEPTDAPAPEPTAAPEPANPPTPEPTSAGLETA